MTNQPIAIFHRLYDTIGEQQYVCFDMLDVEMFTSITRDSMPFAPAWFGRRFYIEWLDTTNPRTTNGD